VTISVKLTVFPSGFKFISFAFRASDADAPCVDG
jgi:hypothetical protein